MSIEKQSNTDLTFFTNEPGSTLFDRFTKMLNHTKYFDALTAYFYTSGFYKLYPYLENAEKIRILVGISLSNKAYELMKQSEQEKQLSLRISNKEAKDDFLESTIKEFEESEDNLQVEEGIVKFKEWLKSGKLEIRVYPEANIHAKLYIMTFPEGEMDVGRIITGSSNFSQSGLIDNLEFNVELKNRSDYEFAKKKFQELWNNSVPVSQDYVETVERKTWLNDTITPYELYLKFLYEYFGEKISRTTDDISTVYLPEDFVDYQFQRDAVIDAKSKLEEFGGVFLADVVGLGKTYISAMLAQQLDGKHLIIAPPALLDEKRPGSWTNIFRDFGVRGAYFKSLGKLEEILEDNLDKYKNVFIDESHRFRTETTISYDRLSRICKGKRVILVSATPLNNSPSDILSQLKLFQNAHYSNLPNPKVRNLEAYFNRLSEKLRRYNKFDDYDKFIKINRENAKDIRENVLKYLMVRRTRGEIEKYYEEDLRSQGLKFPEVVTPKQIYYQFDLELDAIFTKTIKLITSTKFKYSRYTPLLYLKTGLTQLEEISQVNMGKFMKILLIKRLESSFYAFKNTLGRFINSYHKFINEYKKGRVFVSKRDINRIFELLDRDDEATIQRLIDEGRAKEYKVEDFEENFIRDLEGDLSLLNQIQEMWSKINYDPKLDRLIDLIKNDKILKNHKVIIFTESEETSKYLHTSLTKELGNIVLNYSGSSNAKVKEEVIENFDAKAKNQKDDYRILVSTEVLSEGVNLHRSCVVMNYDIPWNPTRVIQRVGRINRVDTKFNHIYVYNFFPTVQSEDEIGLEKTAIAKLNSFIEMLGTDAKLLTDGEPIISHELFTRLNSGKVLSGEEEEVESELEYLKIIRGIRDNQPDLFTKIKQLPKKARSSKQVSQNENGVLTFFRKGKLRKFFLSTSNSQEVKELDFFQAAKILKTDENCPKVKIPTDFYDYLKKNKLEFEKSTAEEDRILKLTGRSKELRLLQTIKALRNYPGLTEADEIFLTELSSAAEKGAISDFTLKNLLKSVVGQKEPLKILSILRNNTPAEVFKEHLTESSAATTEKREVILSEYLLGGNGE